MSHQQNNFELPEEELESNSSSFGIPTWLRWVITAATLSLIGICVYFVCKYISAPKTYVSPKDLGLNSIFLFSITILFAIWVPWERLGIRISKIGGIEFKDIVAVQASEHAEELSYLEDRIESLESYIRKNDGITAFTERSQEPQLRELLIQFLTKYKKWAFSPSRIKAWGSQQQGFSSLSAYDHPFIRSTLQKMVSENLLETRVSKKGNTLYRIPLA